MSTLHSKFLVLFLLVSMGVELSPAMSQEEGHVLFSVSLGKSVKPKLAELGIQL